MKTKLSFFLIVLIAYTLVWCQKDEINKKPFKLTYLTTELGGCNNPSSVQNKSITLKNDTVGISTQNDSISIFVGLNYICCAPFKSEYEIKNDSLLIAIRDTCSYNSPYCYCNCICYYTFDFRFVQSGQENWHYKIELFSPIAAGNKVIQQGTINQIQTY
jgi:hypothetical protein